MALLSLLGAIVAGGAARAQEPPEPAARGYELLVRDELVIELMPHASAGLAQRLIEVFAAARRDTETCLGVPVPPRPRAVLLPDESELRRRFAELTSGRAPPEGAVAIAFPSRRLVLIHQRGLVPGTDSDLPGTLRHELAHLALGPLQVRRNELFPRWLEEGLAELASGRRPDLAERSTLGNWARAGALPPLAELTASFPPHAPAGARAYEVALSFMAWLDAQQGGGGAQRLLRALERGASLDAALHEACGLDLFDAEQAWHQALASDEPWLPGFLLRLDVWSLMGLLALVAVLRHWLRTRRLRAALAAEDAAEEAARAAFGRPSAPPAPPPG